MYVDFGVGSGFGDVVQVGFGVGGEQVYVFFVEVVDVFGFFDGVVVVDVFWIDVGFYYFVQFVD